MMGPWKPTMTHWALVINKSSCKPLALTIVNGNVVKRWLWKKGRPVRVKKKREYEEVINKYNLVVE